MVSKNMDDIVFRQNMSLAVISVPFLRSPLRFMWHPGIFSIVTGMQILMPGNFSDEEIFRKPHTKVSCSLHALHETQAGSKLQ